MSDLRTVHVSFTPYPQATHKLSDEPMYKEKPELVFNTPPILYDKGLLALPPELHVNIFQRLTDYAQLAKLAQCCQILYSVKRLIDRTIKQIEFTGPANKDCIREWRLNHIAAAIPLFPNLQCIKITYPAFGFLNSLCFSLKEDAGINIAQSTEQAEREATLNAYKPSIKQTIRSLKFSKEGNLPTNDDLTSYIPKLQNLEHFESPVSINFALYNKQTWLKNLISLHLSDDPLRIEDLIPFFANNKKIKTLHLTGCLRLSLSESEIPIITDNHLAGNPNEVSGHYIKTLEIRWPQSLEILNIRDIYAWSADYLQKIINDCPQLREIHLTPSVFARELNAAHTALSEAFPNTDIVLPNEDSPHQTALQIYLHPASKPIQSQPFEFLGGLLHGFA